MDKVGYIGVNGKPIKVYLDRKFLKPLADAGKVFCYDSPKFVKGMGTPECYYSVCEDYKAGHVSEKKEEQAESSVP